MTGTPLSRLPGGLYVDLEKGDHRSSVFLAGSGRSGTTWLSEIINHRRGYRYVFEPFNPREVGLFGHRLVEADVDRLRRDAAPAKTLRENACVPAVAVGAEQ